MKTSTRKGSTKKRAIPPRLRRKPFKESDPPPEVQELRRKFREWDESFQTCAKRMAYIRKLCKRIAADGGRTAFIDAAVKRTQAK
jgi:hypothetical protein